MVWGGQEGFLFTGDTAGVVVCHDCKRGRAREVARLGSAVVQMDVGVVEGRVTLLVSAADRCVSITSPQVDGEAQVKQVRHNSRCTSHFLCRVARCRGVSHALAGCSTRWEPSCAPSH